MDDSRAGKDGDCVRSHRNRGLIEGGQLPRGPRRRGRGPAHALVGERGLLQQRAQREAAREVREHLLIARGWWGLRLAHARLVGAASGTKTRALKVH